jgi:Fe-S-cluster formation regulator IscX/YfhJ
LNREYPKKPLDKANYWLSGRELNLTEVKTYAQLIRFSGGDVFLSDDIQTLNEKGIEIIQRILDNPVDRAARPIDLFKRHNAIPNVWFVDSQTSVLGLFNWDDDPKTVSVDLRELKLENATASPFWGDEVFEVEAGTLSAKLAPRACAAFSFE